MNDWFLLSAKDTDLWPVRLPQPLTEQMFEDAAEAVVRNYGGVEMLIVSPHDFWSLAWLNALRARCHQNYNIDRVHGRLVVCPACSTKVRTVRGRIRSHVKQETPAQRLERYQKLRAHHDEGREKKWWHPGHTVALRREVDFGSKEGRAVFGDLARSG